MTRLLPKLRRFLSIPRGMAEVRVGKQPFVHSPQFIALPHWFTLPLICGRVRGRLKCPANATVVLVHNYSAMPLTERSLRYVGITDYIVLRRPAGHVFLNIFKIEALIEWLTSGACKTEFVVYLDSADVFVQDDPAIAVQLLDRLRCDLLFSTEHEPYLYECMPEVKTWTDGMAERMHAKGGYLNAGVFVGRATFLCEVLAAALPFCSADGLSHRELVALIKRGTTRERLPTFPHGSGSDQAILRYLHPRFFPRMQLDYGDALAWRKLPAGGGI